MFITDRSVIDPTTRVSLAELSKSITPKKLSEKKAPAGVSRFLSVNSVVKSKEFFPKIRTEPTALIPQNSKSMELSNKSKSLNITARQ
jgi:hypothetical protein